MIVGLPYAEYRRQLAIANKLEERGCWVEWTPRKDKWGADFVAGLGLGHGYLRINGIEFEEGWDTKNDDLSELEQMESLSWLAFKDSSINDEGLLHLNQFPSLTYLDLEDNVSITDLGLKGLTLTDLRWLNVDGTSVTYDGLKWIAQHNPLLEEESLIERHAIAKLKQTDFVFHASITIESKFYPRDHITIRRRNSLVQWRAAARHLREFPGFVIYQFRDHPIESGPEHRWGLTLTALVLDDGATIHRRALKHAVRDGTISVVAIVPPAGKVVSRLKGKATIRAWYGKPDWLARASVRKMDIPSDAEVVFVDKESLPVTVEFNSINR